MMNKKFSSCQKLLCKSIHPTRVERPPFAQFTLSTLFCYLKSTRLPYIFFVCSPPEISSCDGSKTRKLNIVVGGDRSFDFPVSHAFWPRYCIKLAAARCIMCRFTVRLADPCTLCHSVRYVGFCYTLIK